MFYCLDSFRYIQYMKSFVFTYDIYILVKNERRNKVELTMIPV